VASSHKNQAAILDELFPGLAQQCNPHQFSHPSFNQVSAVGPFMHFLADHKTDARLTPAWQNGVSNSRIMRSQCRNRLHRVRSKEQAVQHKTIVTAQPLSGQRPFKVSLGFETVDFFQHANIESRTRLLSDSLQGDFMTAFGATAVQGALTARGCHSGAKATNPASFTVGPFQGAFHRRTPSFKARLKRVREDG